MTQVSQYQKKIVHILTVYLCGYYPISFFTVIYRIFLVVVALWNKADHYVFILWFLFMVALCNRADHYIFILFLSSFFISSPNLSGQRLDV